MNIEVFLEQYGQYLLEPCLSKVLAIYALYFGPEGHAGRILDEGIRLKTELLLAQMECPVKQ